MAPAPAVAESPAQAREPQIGTEAFIRIEHLSKSFGGEQVLDDVTLEVPRGSGLVILGRSGTGKTVLLKTIIGLHRPDRGRIVVAGDEISALRGAELARARRRIGFLFQQAALFDSIAVIENVAFPLRRHTREREPAILDKAREKLRLVGLEEDAGKMPGDLSGGMRKRVGLARAMALDPDVLLVDEPSAGLDPITSEEIDNLLRSLKEQLGTTLVVVTHNIPSARLLGDDLALLHEGRIIARGTADELDRSDQELVRRFMQGRYTG